MAPESVPSQISRSIEVSYDLHPPPNTSTPNLTSAKSHNISVKITTGGQKIYYESLRGSIGKAKAVLGEELTAWRDAVGKGEQTKESKKTRESDDEDVEDDEE
jgi:hypothetical protein